MKHLVSWYIVPYLTAVALAFVTWLIAIYNTNGAIPVICGLILLGVAIFTIPVMIYMDYRTIKDLVVFGAESYKDPEKRTKFFQEISVRASGQLGVPEILAEFIVKRLIKKFNL